ncbi:MAG TPA: carboxypeptidase regulatory-like domain-containing protein [Acidobacteriota bacterium]|nr:carboxypeptidase regulatory-like domain-containing protein [Acidobacteriota bacterium]
MRGVVVDENGVPLASVQIVAASPTGQTCTVYTDSSGRYELDGLSAGQYHMSLNRTGYFRVAGEIADLKEGLNEVTFTLHHESEIRQSVEVNSTGNPIEPQEPAHQEIMVAREIRDIPVPNTHDLQSVLPALPGIVRDNSGQLHVAGGRSGEAQLFLDGFEIGDPITGALTARVNVDAVRDLEVDAGRYGVQYGRGGAGVLALDTTVGDDKWRAGTTNFIPGFNVEQGVHLGNWYPRFTLSGPIRKGRAWFSEALSLQHTFKLVSELPAGANISTQWAGDNLLRAQINLTPRNLLQGSFLYNRQDNSHLGLGPFSPLSTTRSLRSERSFIAVKDQAWTSRALFDIGVAGDFGHLNSLPMGSQPYIVQPSATAGNYFETLHQRARRWQAIAAVTLPSRHWHGVHNLQAGIHAELISWTQTAVRNSIEVERQDSTLLQRTIFEGPAGFELSDTQIGVYVQDSWAVLRPLILQAGMRADWDRFFQHSILSPRIAANILPWQDERGKLSLAWGRYYQPLRLADVAPAFDQQRLDTFYAPTGGTTVLGSVTSRFALPSEGLKLPSFHTTSAEWIQRIRRDNYAGIHLLFRGGRNGLAYEPQPSIETTRSFLLQNNRRDSYRAAQLSFRHAFSDKAEVSANYTRSRARSNEALDFSLATLVFAPQQPGPLAWDAPNRIISSGWTPIPFWSLFLSYFFEYRSGYPFSVVNQQQVLVGAPNRLRFPNYASLNLGIEKHFKLLSRVWAVRLTIVNVNGRTNPDSVINNVDSPNFLQFAGGQHRAFTARIRLVG